MRVRRTGENEQGVVFGRKHLREEARSGVVVRHRRLVARVEENRTLFGPNMKSIYYY
jgi:hypothetical protein